MDLDDRVLFGVYGDDGNPAGRCNCGSRLLGALDRIHAVGTVATASSPSRSTSQGTVRFMPSSKSICGLQSSCRRAFWLETSLPAHAPARVRINPLSPQHLLR